jgi:hypothetical protein
MSANSFSGQNFGVVFSRIRLQRGMAFGIIILSALLAFEIFNFSTTEYALQDLLGNLTFLGVSWATILAIAFCGVDFAGIARLHTPEAGNGQPSETWYLFGAWLLAATMNAMLTWWGVSLAIVNHSTLGNAVIDRQTLLRVVPIFVAVLVWLIRVLIIGTYSQAGTRLLTQREFRSSSNSRSGYQINPGTQYANNRSLGTPSHGNAVSSNAFRQAQRSANQIQNDPGYSRQEPVYTPVQAAPAGRNPVANPPNQNQTPYSPKPGGYPRS